MWIVQPYVDYHNLCLSLQFELAIFVFEVRAGTGTSSKIMIRMNYCGRLMYQGGIPSLCLSIQRQAATSLSIILRVIAASRLFSAPAVRFDSYIMTYQVMNSQTQFCLIIPLPRFAPAVADGRVLIDRAADVPFNLHIIYLLYQSFPPLSSASDHLSGLLVPPTTLAFVQLHHLSPRLRPSSSAPPCYQLHHLPPRYEFMSKMFSRIQLQCFDYLLLQPLADYSAIQTIPRSG